MRETLRVSELALWLRCRRRTYLQYELNYDSTPRVAGIGTAFHSLIAEYHGKELTLKDVAQIESLDPEAQETVTKMCATYAVEAEADGLDVGQTTYAVEIRLNEVIGGLTLSGQLDHLYFDEVMGCFVVQDTKTVGAFFQTAQRDFQLMTYLWLVVQWLRVNYPDKLGILFAVEHNQVKRNKRTGRAKPPFVQRTRHYVGLDEVEKWGDMLAYMVQDYRDVMFGAENIWPEGEGYRDPRVWAKGTNDCSWFCPFATVCGMIDDPEADVSAVLESEFHKREEAEPHA